MILKNKFVTVLHQNIKLSSWIRCRRSLCYLFVALILFSGCARFRVEELKPSLLFSIPLISPDVPNAEQGIQPSRNGRVLFNFPVHPFVQGDSNLYVSDPAHRIVRIFSGSSERPVKVIEEGKEEHINEKVHLIRAKLGVPGWVVADDAGNIYIQNRPAAKEEPPQNSSPDDRYPDQLAYRNTTMLPSTILQINSKGELQGHIGVEGYNGKPFAKFIRMDCTEDGLLSVYHQDGNDPMLSIYKDGKPIRVYQNLPSGGEDEKKKFFMEIEDMVSSLKGDYIFVAVVLRNHTNYNFQYRRIYRLDGDTNQAKLLLQTDDPSDFFAWSRQDGGFYLLNSEEDGSRMLLKIYSANGEYMNNHLLIFPGIRSSWRETYFTPEGRIFTSRLFQGKFELYEWK